MQHRYYIEEPDRKDGPHDLVTVMRRIRTGKINRSTLIYIDGDSVPQAAANIPEIMLFFDRAKTTPQAQPLEAPSTWALIARSWQFIGEHSIITVYAGAMWLMCMLTGYALIEKMGVITGLMAAWCIFLPLQSIYMVCCLRLYRGQTFGNEFFSQLLGPSLAGIVALSLLLAMMTAGGWFLFLVPGLAVAVMYAFAPFLVFDRRYRIVEAMQASRLLLQKYGRSYIPAITLLILLYLFCIVLIMPIPVVLPLYSIALSQVYEDLSAL